MNFVAATELAGLPVVVAAVAAAIVLFASTVARTLSIAGIVLSSLDHSLLDLPRLI